MFKLIGGIVVYGLALFGLTTLLERPRFKVVVQPAPERSVAETTKDEASGPLRDEASSTGVHSSSHREHESATGKDTSATA